MINWFLDTWWKVVVRPIYFYTVLKNESWKEKPLTFLLINTWILSGLTALVIFLIQYLPIGATLVEGIKGFKFIIILPVLVVLASVFYMITLAIIGAAFILAFGSAFSLVGIILNYFSILIGVKGKLNDFLQRSLYSSAVLLAFIFPLLLAVFVKYGILNPATFRAGYNFIYFLFSIYLYGLWAIAFRKITSTNKWKSFLLAAAPFLFLLILGFAFDKILLTKVEIWIAPLK